MERTDARSGREDAELVARVAALTVEEQVGQLLLAAVAGTALDDGTAAFLRECHIGGAVLFAGNIGTPEETRALTAALEACCGRPGLPAIVAADQEGGRVQRLGPPATSFPSAMAVGATGRPEHARRWGLATGRELRALGLNTDFAPVLDVNNNPRNPVIGVRAYGERPEVVTAFGLAACAGLREGGVVATGKHFPGHGDTALDSHVALPTIAHDRARLDAVELAPFRAAIAAGIPALMATHIVFPGASDDGLPATLSPALLAGLLRDELGFDGVVISDAMRMRAIADRYGVVEGSVRFIAAGGDLVEPLEDDRAVYDALLAAVADGRIPRDRLAAKVGRIARLKRWIAEQGPGDPAWLGAPEHHAWAAAIARDALTLLRDDAGLLPLRRDARLAVIECVGGASRNPAAGPEGGVLLAALRPRFANICGVAVVADEPAAGDLTAARAAVGAADVVLLGTRAAARLPAQAAFVEAVRGWGRPTIAVALAEPYDHLAYPAVPTALALYGADPAMLDALGAALAGIADWGVRSAE